MFVFGALIAATDPISVLAIFRRLGAPRRLAALVESESLLNDGTAIVLFGIALTIVDEGGFTIAEGVFDFVRVAGGGVLLGLAVGYLAVAVIRRIDDHLLEITITTLVAFGTNLLAEQMHVSGVLGIVVAGLFLGQQRTTAMSPTTRVALDSFWEYVGFVGNAFIFLLIGQRVAAGSLLDELPSIAVAIVVVLVSRALIVAAANAAVQPWKQHVPWRWTPLVWWGGVRGAVALALALALPASVSSREWIQTTTFGIVIFSLLVQGLTIKRLLMRLGIAGADGVEVEADRHSARIQAYEEALRDVRLQAMQGALSESLSLPLAAEFQRLIDDERDSQRFAQTAANTPAANQLIEGRRHALLAARQQMFELWRQGRLSDDALLDLTDEINAFIDELDRREPAPSPQ
jgi:CPA1 family monovalent cation:H+ antiporter